ncbi:Lysine--tRNA ligase [Actinidia chinensis var. chinensis]|uniref:Lysine--tRNA ligase n=1 Tax=Actinidia chinensis var. chinensis TaxID=1590841 RepID=A0A2R6Q9L1_ACTCC|nr:Lysine--tRNA ligase [Actinidia chinensis var. chinensis]
MAETSALCFSIFSYSLSSVSRTKEITYSSLYSPPLAPFRRFSISRSHPSSRLGSIGARASNSGNFIGDEPFGFYPWDSTDGDDVIQWVPQERITLFTADGLIQIGGSMVPRRIPPSDKRQGKSKTSQRYQRFQESDYMDPGQSLCLGALFDIAATNGLDMGRRLCILGFCRSIEMLSDVVEDTVLEHGGEVVTAETAIKGGLHEKLTMTVAVPLLWGVPPASETLHLAVQSGGGIVDKVYWQWDFM